jgi:hypothetical protein
MTAPEPASVTSGTRKRRQAQILAHGRLARSVSGAGGRSELAGLYLRVAETLERSARLAEQHAERERIKGRPDGGAVELARAESAREAARRGRELAAQLR